MEPLSQTTMMTRDDSTRRRLSKHSIVSRHPLKFTRTTPTRIAVERRIVEIEVTLTRFEP